MGATLEALQDLQKIELKLAALRGKIDSKRRLVQSYERKIDNLDRLILKKHEEIKTQQISSDQLELEVKTRDAEIDRLREALNSSKTNKEYAAILAQLNTEKADSGKLEEQVLEIMNAIEALQQQEQELVGKKDKEVQSRDNAQKVVDSFQADSQDELETLQRERDQAAGAVPASVLEVFERIAERHEGEAMAMVVQPHPKRQEFMCDGCNMGVTLEQYSALQSRDDIQVCKNCGRILFLDTAHVSR